MKKLIFIIAGLSGSCTPHHQDDATAKLATLRFEILGSVSAAAHGIAVSPDGASLYIADSFGRTGRGIYVCPMQSFTEEDCRYEARGMFNTPAGLLFEGNELIVSDVGTGRVSKHSISPWAEAQTTWDVPAIWNITKIAENDFRGVTDAGEFVRLVPGDAPETLKSGLHFPFGITIASDGNLWVTEQNGDGTEDGNLLQMSPAGELLQTISDGLRNPEGVAADDEGGVWVVETHLGELRHYNAAGERTYIDLDTFAIPVSIVRVPNSTDMIVFDVSGGKVVKVSIEPPL